MVQQQTEAQPVLDEATRTFVRCCLSAGLAQVDDIKKVVVSLMMSDANFSPKRIAEGMVSAGMLTPWQANKLLQGKKKGFFLGNYRLLRPLGKGGMGVVYLGEHHVMKRMMALKILPPEACGDKRRIERFKEEARASAQLDHENIVRAYDFSQAGGKLFIVMEYIDGIDLQHAVQRDGVWSVAMALDAITQATRGIAHAHDRGIIHRDVKPSNILIRSDGVVKVSDMGLARVSWMGIDEQDSSRRLMGTADFVAPEQAIDSKSVDARADIYSLGCTLYYLLTGRPPFSGENLQQRLAHHQTSPVPDVRDLHKDCPASVADLIFRMMAKRPEDRPKSAANLLTRLDRLLSVHGAKSSQGAQLGDIAPAGDTDVDKQLMQATMDDSLFLSSDSEIPVAVEVLDSSPLGLDFANLPPLEVSHVSGPLSTPSAATHVATKNAEAPLQASSHRSDMQQMLLLGVGLTVAIFALLLVLGISAYTLTRPMDESPRNRIRKTEGPSGNQVIYVEDRH